MALTAVATWILDNGYGPVPANSTTAPVRTPKVNLYDGLAVEEPTSNLLLNPGFTGSGVPNSWSVQNTATATVSSVLAFGGTTSVLFTSANSSGTLQQSVFLFAGTSYVLSGRARLTALGGAVGGFIYSTSFVGTTVSTASAVGSWQQFLTTYTPTTSGFYNVGVNNQGSGSVSAYVDNLQLEIGSSATSYCDGSIGSGYSWDASSNLLPSSPDKQSFEDGGANYDGITSNTTITNSTTFAMFGSKSLKVVASAANSGGVNFVVPAASVTKSSPGLHSVYVYIPAGSTITSFSLDTAINGFYGVNTATAPVTAGQWNRIAGKLVNSVSGQTVICGISPVYTASSETYYIDGNQFEQRAYLTPFNATAASAPTTTSSRQQGAISWSAPAVPTTGFTLSVMFRASEKHVTSKASTIVSGSTNSLAIYVQNGLVYTSNGYTINAQITTTTFNVGDLVFVALLPNGSGATAYAYVNGVSAASNVYAGTSPGINGSAFTLTSGDEAAIEQLLIHQTTLIAAQVATLAAGGVGISDDPAIIFEAAGKNTAGTTSSMSTLGTGTKRGRLTTFNTYGAPEAVPLAADSTTPGGGIATYRVTAQNASGVGVGDSIGFSQTPTSNTYQVVGVQAAPGQYDELYLVKLN